MLNVSPDALAYLKACGLIGVTIYASGLDGELTITGSDLVDGSLSIDRNSVSSSNIEIGNAETTELSFSLANYDHRFDAYRFEGAILTVVININGELLNLGMYTVDAPAKKYGVVSIVALDFMAKFNKVFAPTISGTATLLELLQNCCDVCNVTLFTLEFINDDYVVTIPAYDPELTFHQVIIWIAELSGTNAWINMDGQLVLGWYSTVPQNGNARLSSAERFSFEMAENDLTITGLLVTTADENDQLFGTAEYALTIEDNGLLPYADVATVLNPVFTQINGFTYRPFNFSTVGLPYLLPLDAVTITDTSGVEYTSVITCHKYVLNHLSQIIAKGETKEVSGYATSAPFTARQKKIIQSVASAQASEQVNFYTQATLDLNTLMSMSMGFYETLEPIAGTDPVAYNRFIHDKPLLVDSQTVYQYGADGFRFSVDGMQTWSTGMDKYGNILAKVITAYGIEAEWIKTGILGGLTSDSIRFDLTNNELHIGLHDLDIEDETLKFTSSVTDDKLDYVFQKADPVATCDMQVKGTFDTTDAFAWGTCRAERRNDTGNEGIDFVF